MLVVDCRRTLNQLCERNIVNLVWDPGNAGRERDAFVLIVTWKDKARFKAAEGQQTVILRCTGKQKFKQDYATQCLHRPKNTNISMSHHQA